MLFAMRVCLEEIFCNIVMHGNPDGVTGGYVDVEIGLDPTRGCLCMSIEDDGPAFDISQAEAHPVSQSLEETEPGGLGILLIRNFSDKLIYRRTDGRNRVTVEFTG